LFNFDLFLTKKTYMKKPLIFTFGLLISVSCLAQIPAYKDKNLSVDLRVKDLLSRMTVEEKVGQLNQVNGGVLTGPTVANDPGAAGKMNLLRQGKVGSFLNVVGTEQTLAVQKEAINNTRLGIPLLFAFDVIHGYKTVFPIPLAEACSWDLAGAQNTAAIAAKEASSAGLHWTFAPMMDVSREPRWGRVMEGSGEDPYLQARFAEARVTGFQGDLSDNEHVMACVKHFAAYGAVEAGKEYNTVDVSRYALWNYYMPSYKAAVKAGAATVMNSFNILDGVPASGNGYLVNDVLKKKWGFDGFVVSDWASFGEMIAHGYSANETEAAKQAILAGSDMDMESQVFNKTLVNTVNEGDVPLARLDEAVERILRMKFKLGLFDDPYKYHDAEREKRTLLAPEHIKVARDAASSSMVLLKNEILPLKKELKNILVLGHLSESQDDVLDFWKGQGDHKNTVTILEGIKAKYPNAKVSFVKACTRDGEFIKGSEKEIKSLAKKADAIIATIGLYGDLAGEARALGNLNPPAGQMEMLAAAKATKTPMVVLVQAGRPLILTDVVKEYGTILYTWIGGSQHGNGVADILAGDVNPSAKTVMSFPASLGQVPVYYNHYNSGRPHSDGQEGPDHFWVSRYRDIPNEPLFPFGYGLSYSTFAYSDLKLSKTEINKNETVTVEVKVTNTSKIDGIEIVQLYIRDLVAQPIRPVKELKDFKRIMIKAGETAVVKFELPAVKLGFYDENGDDLLQKGAFKVFVGTNSKEVLSADLELK
jgi:beta-glucosidase